MSIAQHLIAVVDADRGGPFDRGADSQQVIVPGWLAIADLGTGQHQQKALVLQVLVVNARHPQEFDTGLLEVHQIVRMVQQPHAVRLCIAHPDLDLAAGHPFLLHPVTE